MSERIILNVGGEKFETRKSTLEHLQYFRDFFNSHFYNLEDKDSEIFIDRDPKAFRLILNAMRDPTYIIPAKYWNETKFYGLGQREDLKIPQNSKAHIFQNQKSVEFYESDDEVCGSIGQLIATNLQTLYCSKVLEIDAFTKKKSPVIETTRKIDEKWVDQLTFITHAHGLDIGQNLILLFGASLIGKESLKSAKDYYDLIENVEIFLSKTESPLQFADFLNERDTKNAKDFELYQDFELYEYCSSDSLYFRYKHSQNLKNSKEFRFANVLPIFIGDQKICTKATESYISHVLDSNFFIKIKFKKEYLLKISDLKIRSHGYILENRRNFFNAVNSAALFRWAEYSEENHKNFGKRTEIRFFERFYLLHPIESFFLKIRIPYCRKYGARDSSFIKFLDFKLDNYSRITLSGLETTLEYTAEGVLILWYYFSLGGYLFPSRINHKMYIYLSDGISKSIELNTQICAYEFVNCVEGDEGRKTPGSICGYSGNEKNIAVPRFSRRKFK